MYNINIKTTLGKNKNCCCNISSVFKYITRGETALFEIDLEEKVYALEDIYQMTFMFKQGSTIWKFDLYDKDNNSLNKEFNIDNNVITLTLSPAITTQFSETGYENNDEYDLINYEIATILDINNGVAEASDAVLIEPQYLIGVKDSIYASTLKKHF